VLGEDLGGNRIGMAEGRALPVGIDYLAGRSFPPIANLPSGALALLSKVGMCVFSGHSCFFSEGAYPFPGWRPQTFLAQAGRLHSVALDVGLQRHA
jgi:hypothetical protein